MRSCLSFLQLNDLHGYVEPHQELLRDGRAASAARRVRRRNL